MELGIPTIPEPVPPPEQEQSEEERKIVARVQKHIDFKAQNSSRQALQRQWYENLLFRCIAEGTEIPLLDGTRRTIEALVDGPPCWVYGFDIDSLRIVPSRMETVWQTGEKQCVEVALDTGEVFTCTADHRILTWFGYVMAGELALGTPLVPFREQFYKARGSASDTYAQIFQPFDARWEQAHRMIAQAMYGDIPKGFVVHHKNEIKKDNRPENLEPMSMREHSLLTLNQHKDKIITAVRKYKRSAEGRAEQSARCKRQWAENRERMMEANRSFRARPGYRERLREGAAAFWSDPEKRAKRIAQMREHWETRGAEVNCRVVSVTPVGMRKVYDATVPFTSNFAIGAGVFVHNCGQQWLGYSRAGKEFVQLKTPQWFPKVTQNHIKKRCQQLEANLLKRKPAARVRPATNEASDIDAAKDAEYLLAHIDDAVNESALRQRAANAAPIMGTVISYEWFNPNWGPETEVPEETLQPVPVVEDQAQCPQCGFVADPELVGAPCPQCAGTGDPMMDPGMVPTMAAARIPATGPGGGQRYDLQPQPVMHPETGEPVVHRVRPGRIESEIILPFFFFADDNADTLEKSPWCGHVSWASLEWIKQRFPDRGPFVKEEGGYAVTDFYRQAMLSMVGQSEAQAGFGESAATSNTLKGGALVINYQELPTPELPQGLHVVMANGVVLHADKLPVQDPQAEPEYSYTLFQFDLVPGRLWGDEPVSHAIPSQRRINGILSQLVLNRKTMANPVILAPSGSGLEKPGAYQWRPGAVIPYNWTGLGLAPQVQQGTALPEQVLAELRMALEFMNECFSTEEVQGGEAPSGVKSGIGLAQLTENAETVHAPRTQRWEDFIAARGRKRLLLARANYTEQRLVKIRGIGSAWTIKQLVGADIGGNTDVVVEAGSALPRSRQAQLQLAIDILEMFPELRQDPIVRQAMMEEAGLTFILPPDAADIQLARRENAMMDQGEPVAVTPHENKIEHLKIHLEDVRGPRFADLPPEVQQVKLDHIKQTKLALMQELALEAQGGAMEPGAKNGAPVDGARASAENAPPEQPAAAGGGGVEE